MFKFNFNVPVEEDAILPEYVGTTNETKPHIECYDCELIEFDHEKFDNLEVYKSNCTKFIKNDLEFKYISSENLSKIPQVSTKDIAKADINHSDLIPGIYEGGAKIWECTEDLLEYLTRNIDLEYIKNKSVLDLGCGVGLLGVLTLQQGANRVWFQDYNKDVLENVTIPTVLLNVKDLNSKTIEKCKFYSGDWMKFTEFTREEEKFDLILTSETIYNSENHKKLLDTFDSKLKADGTVLLAAKTYYFGVGGGLRQFEKLILSDKRFTSNVVWNSTNGVCREIIKIQRNINMEN